MPFDSQGKRAAVLLLVVPFVAGCEVLEIQPLSGFAGDPVTLRASAELKTPAVVEFGGGAEDSSPVADPSDPYVLTATVPLGADTGPVRVQGPGYNLKSEFEFTVLKNVVVEAWSNDTRDDPQVTTNVIPWGSRIEGTIEEEDRDWFYFKSGPAGPWAYTLEILVVNESDDMLNVDLHIASKKVLSMNVGPRTPASSTNPAQPTKRRLWATTLDDANTHLRVRKAPGPQTPNPAEYHIDIAKVSVRDGREPNEDFATAGALPQMDGAKVYLTTAYEPGADPKKDGIGAADYFEIPAVSAGEELVVSFGASDLGFGSSIAVGLHDMAEAPILELTAPADDPLVVFRHVVGSKGGAANGTDPWYLRVETVGGPDPWSGKHEAAPARTRVPYSLAVLRAGGP